jgi:transcriptional regulator with XRE-family HTH domain
MIIDGGKFKERRISLGLSQKDISHEICHQSMISRIENRGHITSMTILRQLCDRLSMNITDLIDAANNGSSPLTVVRTAIENREYKLAEELLTRRRQHNQLYDGAETEYHILRARILNLRGDYDAALTELEVAMMSCDAMAYLLRIEIHAETAYSWTKKGAFENGIRHINLGMEVMPKLGPELRQRNNTQVVLLYLNAAYVYFEIGSYESSRQYARIASQTAVDLKNFPYTVEVQLLRAQLAKVLAHDDERAQATQMAFVAAEFSNNQILKDVVSEYLQEKKPTDGLD